MRIPLEIGVIAFQTDKPRARYVCPTAYAEGVEAEGHGILVGFDQLLKGARLNGQVV